MSTTLAAATAQFAEAEHNLREKITQAREANPEYTLAENATALGTEIGVYVRAQGVESDWTFLRVHDGTDADLIAHSLRLLGAPVHVVRQMLHLNMQGDWEQTVSAFNSPSESQRLAAEIAAMYRQADHLERDWFVNSRIGDSGATQMRREAGYKVERLKNLDPSYPVRSLRPRKPEVAKGWYASG